MNYKGIIIEESLQNTDLLDDIKIISTKVEEVTPSHKTPWLKKWTLHTVEISETSAGEIAAKLSSSLDAEHEWYADYKNENYHFVIFRGKVFKVNRHNPKEYDAVKDYGVNLGIPDYQLTFSSEVKV
ncbi:MAG: hypothetical protein V1917_00835 [Candidatus Gottesmanbacteria bacterium]